MHYIRIICDLVLYIDVSYVLFNIFTALKYTISEISFFLIHLNRTIIFNVKFLGHLSHSGDLLLWVGVRRRAVCVVRRPSSVVRRPLTSSSQELLGQS